MGPFRKAEEEEEDREKYPLKSTYMSKTLVFQHY
jgi:hypothetical protein